MPVSEMEAYERLRTEIVRSAVTDLKKAIKKSKRLGYVCEEQKSLEEWFISDWGQTLCANYGEYIVERCRKALKSRGGT